MKPVFLSYMFDSRQAWESAVSDPSYKYDMPFNQFMDLYKYYRSGKKPVNKSIHIVSHTHPRQEIVDNSGGELLSQNEIDSLIQKMMGDVEQVIVEKPKEPDFMDGLLSQDDIDALYANMK